MRTGRLKLPLELTQEERETLRTYTRRGKTAQRLALRARIVLPCFDGLDNKSVAKKLGLTTSTVGKWRGRFVQSRLEGLLDEPRPGVARTISDAKAEEIINKTLESTPAGATHWSKRQMAEHMGLGRMTVSRAWRAFGLQPHRTETFKLSKRHCTTSLFAALNVHTGKIIGAYHRPHRAQEFRRH